MRDILTQFKRLGNYIKGVIGHSEREQMRNDYWFETEIGKIKYKDRIHRIMDIEDYLHREHKVLGRPNFEFKEKTFETAKIVIQTLKSVIKFHTGYICSNPVSLTGDKELVALLNKVYQKGNYAKTDMEIAKDLITYGDCFEYVYLDENDNIRSKLIRNKDSFPIYDSNGRYTNFVEHWKDEDTRQEYYVVYYPEKVDIYEDRTLVETRVNLTGLPIWYSGMDKSKYDKFGEPFIVDLIPVMDSIEYLLSKLDDAVSTLSLSPIGIVSGQPLNNANASIPKDMVGVTMHLEDGGVFSYANAVMDNASIKLELDYLIQQFYAIACVPASILGSANVNNVSEVSITLLYQQTDNFCKQYIASMKEGFSKRLEYIRKLLSIKGVNINNDVFDSIAISFNVNKPVDNATDIANMQIQYNCGALSKQTIIDKSPYTTDTALEMQRIEDEKRAESQQGELPASNLTIEEKASQADVTPIEVDKTVN